MRNLIRSGVPETVAMSITGHKTRAVFDRYNIASTRDQQEALEKMQLRNSTLEKPQSLASFQKRGGKQRKTGHTFREPNCFCLCGLRQTPSLPIFLIPERESAILQRLRWGAGTTQEDEEETEEGAIASRAPYVRTYSEAIESRRREHA